MKKLVLILLIFVLLINTLDAQWQEANNGLPSNTGLPSSCDISSIVISGRNIFAGIPFWGVYLSSNNGKSWKAFNTGLKDNNIGIHALTISGNNIFAGTDSGLYFSLINESSWALVMSFPINCWVNTIATSENNIVIGTWGKGVYLSSDNGSSWTAMNNGLPANTCVNSIAISGSNIFIGTGDYDNRVGYGVYLSSDNGNSWNVINTGLLSYYKVDAITVNRNNIFVGITLTGQGTGIYMSSNNGKTWNYKGLLSGTFATSFAVNDSNIFASTWKGIYLSSNSGSNWIAVNSGLPTYSNVNALAISDSNIFVGISNEVYFSSNNGSSWAAIDSGLPEFPHQVYALAVNGNNIYAGTDTGVYFSQNNRNYWSAMNNGLPDYTRVAAITIIDSNVYIGTGNGVYLFSISQNTWIAANSGLPKKSSIKSFTTNGNKIYVVTRDSGIYLSSNNGSNWTKCSSDGLIFNSLAINGNNIFVGTQREGVYMSINNENSWTEVNNGFPSYTIITSLSIFENTILAATWYNGVYTSSNNGKSWKVANKGLFLDSSYVRTFAIYGDTIFAGVDNRYHHGSGFYLSKDKGLSWSAQSKGLPENTCVYSIAISDSNIFAGTWGSGGMDGSGIYDIGMWKRPLSDFKATEIKKIDVNLDYAIYPNPVNDRIIIESIKKDINHNGLFSVYDLQGKLILKRILQPRKTDIDMSGFERGVYILRLIQNNSIENYKIIKE